MEKERKKETKKERERKKERMRKKEKERERKRTRRKKRINCSSHTQMSLFFRLGNDFSQPFRVSARPCKKETTKERSEQNRMIDP